MDPFLLATNNVPLQHFLCWASDPIKEAYKVFLFFYTSEKVCFNLIDSLDGYQPLSTGTDEGADAG